MKFFKTAKDGGEESHVTGFFIVEIKSLFSIVLLHFRNGTREAFHSHAFNAITWFLKGQVTEHRLYPGSQTFGPIVTQFLPSFVPKITLRSNLHKVFSLGDTWALSFRGPWKDSWIEYRSTEKKFVTLTHGRKTISEIQLTM